MTKVYDFSVTDIREHNYAFGEMTEAEIDEKKKKLEEHQKSKIAAQQPRTDQVEKKPAAPGPAKPVFKPKIKPPGPPPASAPPTT
jgi:hypothetical protein